MLVRKLGSRALLRLSMVCLLVFSLLNMVARSWPPVSPFWDGVLDGSRGMALGLMIGLTLLFFRAHRRSPR